MRLEVCQRGKLVERLLEESGGRFVLISRHKQGQHRGEKTRDFSTEEWGEK